MRHVTADDASSSDEELVIQSLTDPAAFSSIFTRHFSPVYAYLARRVGSDVADELTAQVFVVAFERRQAFRPSQGSARPWLYRIATNLLANHRRAEQRLLQLAARLGDERTRAHERTGADDDALASLDLQRAAAAIADLEPSQRDVLLLHTWAGLGYEEIAIALDVPVGTVRSRLWRARQGVRARIGGCPAPATLHIPMTEEGSS
jgi:RNA polymerase sigma factor (sigma-70 family)